MPASPPPNRPHSRRALINTARGSRPVPTNTLLIGLRRAGEDEDQTQLRVIAAKLAERLSADESRGLEAQLKVAHPLSAAALLIARMLRTYSSEIADEVDLDRRQQNAWGRFRRLIGEDHQDPDPPPTINESRLRAKIEANQSALSRYPSDMHEAQVIKAILRELHAGWDFDSTIPKAVEAGLGGAAFGARLQDAWVALGEKRIRPGQIGVSARLFEIGLVMKLRCVDDDLDDLETELRRAIAVAERRRRFPSEDAASLWL